MMKQQFLTRIRSRWQKILVRREGQSTTEYILILAIVVMFATKVKSTLTQKVINEGLNNLDFKDAMQTN